MCLAKLFKVKSIESKWAFDENNKKVKLNLMKDVKVGDYLLVLSDIAVDKVPVRQAKSMRQII
ncbi:hypothetical protein A3J15_02015 [Candidatus Roizmanbacteria bacterium RIFCSPLOWO2_02_FULL_38_10]|uniref:Uncharacterized protein n=1 Tax=Candidatus Roizmanbacteria bacterium RIFCSPLOWO2_02_FULL_38_10 TaxID=1802074 RepID=A0A1F7JN78_9BACT|nr:MAG: hypothetical protein A3J15_02015 [Candidatus Roizmanbacteria bacterium RIFCSPLOWO2_02_FULL_38_10]